MDHDACLIIAEETFAKITAQFPSLAINRDCSTPVDLSIDIPVQPGLKYAVNLNLQNRDELHFSVEKFWLGWFPCTVRSRVEAYIDAVVGFLSGHYRILEHYRGNKCAKAELQMPIEDGGWVTIGVSHHWALSLSWRKSVKVIRNA